MHGKLKAAAAWIGRAFCEADGSPSSKRILFGLAVVFARGLCTGQFFRAGLDPQVVDLAKAVVFATAGGYVGGRYCETKEQ